MKEAHLHIKDLASKCTHPLCPHSILETIVTQPHLAAGVLAPMWLKSCYQRSRGEEILVARYNDIDYLKVFSSIPQNNKDYPEGGITAEFFFLYSFMYFRNSTLFFFSWSKRNI